MYYRIADVLEEVLSTSDIVVRVEKSNGSSHYEIFKEPEILYNRIQNTQNVSFHEITRIAVNKFPPVQSLYFDIDAPISIWNNMSGKVIENIILVEIIKHVKEWASSVKVSMCNEYVATSSDYLTKVSLHIVFPILQFKNHFALGQVARLIRNQMQPWISNCIDLLYKKNQGLRLMYSNKLGTDRKKQPFGINWPTNPIETLLKSTIHRYDLEAGYVLDSYAPAPLLNTPLCISNIGLINKILHELENAEKTVASEEHTESPPLGGVYVEHNTKRYDSGRVLIELRRKFPSTCIVCRRVHMSENAYIVSFKGVYKLRCYRSESSKAKVFYIDNEEVLRSKQITALEKESLDVVNENYINLDETIDDILTYKIELDSSTAGFADNVKTYVDFDA